MINRVIEEKLGVLEGSVESPTSIHRPVPASAQPGRWDGIGQLLAEEFRNLPRRIRAIFNAPHPRIGVEQRSPYPWGYGQEIPCAEYMFQDACNSYIQQLLHENDWAGRLDIGIAVESFQQGATWGLHNSCNSKRCESNISHS